LNEDGTRKRPVFLAMNFGRLPEAKADDGTGSSERIQAVRAHLDCLARISAIRIKKAASKAAFFIRGRTQA